MTKHLQSSQRLKVIVAVPKEEGTWDGLVTARCKVSVNELQLVQNVN